MVTKAKCGTKTKGKPKKAFLGSLLGGLLGGGKSKNGKSIPKNKCGGKTKKKPKK